MTRRSHSILWIVNVTTLVGSALPVCAKDTEEPEIDYRVAQVSTNAGGVYKYAPGTWGLLHLDLSNQQEQDVELLCTTYFGDEPTLQYGRRIWLPALSRLQTWHPVRVPPVDAMASDQIQFSTLVSEVGESREVLVRNDIGSRQSGGVLRVVRPRTVTGIIDTLWGSSSSDVPPQVSAFNVAMTGRLKVRLAQEITTIGDRVLPAEAAGYQALGHLVVADDRMLGDAAATSAIRNWLFDGGHLWIMLDQVDPELLGALLGDESSCHAVDSVTLTSVQISPAADDGGMDSPTDYERPVKLIRVLLDEDTDVPYVVNGWPAAFRKQYGAGQLLVTTLEGTAWVNPDTFEPDGPPAEKTGYSTTRPFQSLMESFYLRSPDVAASAAESLEPQVGQFVGYSVPSRRVILGLLGAFIIAIGGFGTLFLKRGRLERLSMVTPPLAIGISITLILLGRAQQLAVPPTTALLQVMQPLPGTDDIRITGAAGLYSHDAGTMHLSGSDGDWVVPELAGTEGTTRRMVWSDLNRWQWENVPQSPGLRAAEVHQTAQLPSRLKATAEFGPRGLTGQLFSGESLLLSDLMLATSAGRMGVELLDDGRFEVRSDAILGASQYLSAGILSDRQSRRNQLLSLLLDRGAHLPTAPSLYAWSSPWKAGLEISGDARVVGDALVILPIEFIRPPAGTRVSLPPPLLPYRSAVGPDGITPGGLYNNRQSTWSEKARPSVTWLRFQIPQVLLPLNVSSARIAIRVTGPIGKLELAVSRDDEVIPIKTWTDPIGGLSLELEGPQLPEVQHDGGLFLFVAAGDDSRPELTMPDREAGKLSYWRIESLDMELDAEVTD